MTNLYRFSIGFLTGLLVATVVCMWKAKPVAVVGETIQELAGKTQEAQVRTVYVYRDAKKPKGTQPSTEVLTAVKTKDGTATALLDPVGHTSIVLTTDPLPWLAKSREWHGSLYIGAYDQKSVYRATLERSFFQTKRVHWGTVVSADKGPEDTKLFLGIGFRF